MSRFATEMIAAEQLPAFRPAAAPTHSEPVLSEPEVAEPVLSEPDVAEPVLSEPVLSEPDVAEPEVAEPVTAPRVDDGDTEGMGSDFRVLLYNDEFHSMDEVVEQVVKATRCSTSKAEAITLEAHSRGRAVCFRGERPRCQDVCRVLREIRLQCEVDCD